MLDESLSIFDVELGCTLDCVDVANVVGFKVGVVDDAILADGAVEGFQLRPRLERGQHCK